MTDGEHRAEKELNPYKPPMAEVVGARLGERVTPPGEPTEAMIAHLKGTGPWALFLAILGFISAGFMLLSGLSSAVAAPFVIASEGTTGLLPFGAGIVVFAAVVYVVGGAAYGITSYFLLRFSLANGQVGRLRTMETVESALGLQHKFWKSVGVTVIVLLVFGLFFAVAVVAFALSMASATNTP